MSEAFDPDKYLAAKAAQPAAFNPDAYLAQVQGARAAPQVGGGETFVNKGVDALPTGRITTNILSTLALQAGKALGAGSPTVELTPQALAEAKARGMNVDQSDAIPGVMDTYRQQRDRFASRTEAGAEQNPLASGLGTATGTALSLLAPLPKASVGAGAGGRIASNALTGGAYGALNAATNGPADLTQGQVGQFARDALGVDALHQGWKDAKDGNIGRSLLDLMGAGGIGGLATGGVLGAGIEGARATGITGKLGDALKRLAIDKGRKVLTNGADQLSTRAAVPEAAVEEAIRSKAIVPFGTNQGAASRLEGLTENVGDQYGEIIAELEAKGAKGPDARAVADDLLGRGAALERNTMDNALPREYLNQADNLLGKAGPQGELGLTQAEKLKRSLQKMANYNRVNEPTMNEVHRDIASAMRSANEGAIAQAGQAAGPGSEIAALADQFGPVKGRLANLYEAENAAARGAARGAQRGAGSDFGLKTAVVALGSGHPELIPGVVASNVLKSRGGSTVASYGLKLSDLLGNTGQGGGAGRMAELLANALRGEPAPMSALPVDDEEARRRALIEAIRGQGGGMPR